MNTISIRRILVLITVITVAAAACFTAQSVWAGTARADAKATTKAAKPKTVTINIVVMADQDAQVDLTVSKKKKKKTSAITRTVELKKGLNYFTYDKGKKGKYTVSVVAFGDTMKQKVTAVQGAYTTFFKVAPPKDGDNKEVKAPTYKDLSKIKQKK